MGKDKRRRSDSSSPERTRKKKSRSRDREKHKKSKDRKRSRSRDRERKRSRSRERKSEKRRRSRSRETKSKGRDSRGNSQDADYSGDEGRTLDKDKEQARLEMEMTRRRDRIEKWRAEKRKKELENAAAGGDTAAVKEEEVEQKTVKKWSLEEDGDGDDGDEEDVVIEDQTAADGDDELDPLDAYMSEVSKEVRKIKGAINSKNAKVVKTVKGAKKEETKNGDGATNGEIAEDGENPAPPKKKVFIMTGVAKKKTESASLKPDFIEQNQDGLEYSSEEEAKTLDELQSRLEKKKKEVVKTDHDAMNYPPFRKDFYCEVPEIARMTDAEVEDYRQEMEGIKTKGKKVPRPIKNWPQCGVSSKVLHLLKKHGYEKPTPIQAQSIPVIMSGRDHIGIAKTGSGKTLAFLLPLFRHIADQDPLEEGDGPIAVIMTPTRELCLQIGKECRKFIKCVGGARAVCVYGGTGISEQIAELKRGAEIIVCTPGRMIDMLAANAGKVTNLRRVTMLILDEADRMFDMGFEPQVMRVLENCRPDRQTVMFSATFPRQMEGLARRILNKPVEVQVGGRSVVSNEIEQHICVIDEDAKFLKLLEVIGNYIHLGSVLIFVDKQEHADGLLKDLMNASYTSCASLHGGIDQYDRDSTIVDFKAGKTQILVATSVAARGLDVKNLVLVVNFDCPNHYEDYVHRVGRTGRAGNEGFAYTFITAEQDWYSGDIIRALELSEALVPQELRDIHENFKIRMNQEGRKVKTGGGFGGTGFKFDETEATYTSEKKKFQKAALGLQDSDDDDVEQEIDAQIESLLSAKRTIKAIDASSILAPGSAAAAAGSGGDFVPVPKDKLELAKQLAAKLNAKTTASAKSEVEKTTEGFVRGTNNGGTGGTGITAKSVADQLAARLNAKLNYVPGEGEIFVKPVEEGGLFQKYEEELEINDFPQQARWKVTSKEALAQISEYSEAGITVRGTYYAPGKPVPDGERKLYLAIESTAELSVQKAKVEITRLLKEELLKLSTSAIHHINKGRYAVL